MRIRVGERSESAPGRGGRRLRVVVFEVVMGMMAVVDGGIIEAGGHGRATEKSL